MKSELDNGGLGTLRRLVPVSIGLYTGPFLAAQKIQSLRREVEAVRAAGYGGLSFFC